MDRARIVRRIFFVPLANDAHGKTSLLKALHNQAARKFRKAPHRGKKLFITPWGREVDVLFSPRSYQETLKKDFGTIRKALTGISPDWTSCELVIFPSHLDTGECGEILNVAHEAGFDCICMPVFISTAEMAEYADCLSLNWDERWTMFNDKTNKSAPQLSALGHDLWTWLAAAITRQ